jgi:hypothetical protein
MRHTLHLATVAAAMLWTPAVAWPQEVETVVASQEPLLCNHEKTDRQFHKLQIGDTVSYFHQRMIGEAIVERDFIRYQFNVDSGDVIEHTVQWRDDLPATADPVIAQDEAESMAEGDVLRSTLYFISPDSYVFPLTPTPDGPCWIVRSDVGGWPVVSIIDAVTGEDLGRGVPPPAEGLSLSGPQPEDIYDCSDPWTDWYTNAHSWYTAMGYSTAALEFPHTATIGHYIRSVDLAVFYELAHGSSTSFRNWCPEYTTAADVESWLDDYASVPFAFVGSCGGLCSTGDNTFAHEFRKGLGFGAASVGYCGMGDPPCEDNCWPYSVDWQDTLFTWLHAGYDVATAYNQANLAYPTCASGDCMRTAGDIGMTLVPKVIRSLCGNVYDGQVGPLEEVNSRPYYLLCDIHVPGGQTLTFGYAISVGFLNNARIIADGTAQTPSGWVWFVREMDHSVGMKVHHFGRMRMTNGGTIRIYE